MFRSKKAIALVLAAVMLLSLAACGKAPAEPTQAVTNAPTQEGTKAPVEGGLQTALWTLSYDDALWVVEEGYPEDDESGSEIRMAIPDPGAEDEDLVYMMVSAFYTDHENFRDNLKAEGYDAYEYVVNDAYEKIQIGGLQLLSGEEDDDYAFYFTRLPDAGVDVEIEIIGDIEHAAVTAVMESLTFTVEENGNEDAPWPWDGTPYAVDPGQMSVGSFTLLSTQIPFAESIVTDETFDNNVAVLGQDVYLMNDGVAQKYTYDGTNLTFVQDLPLEGEYETVDAAGGKLWFSGFMEDMVAFDGSAVTATYEDADRVAMGPDGSWGIGWFVDPEIKKLTVSGDTLSSQDFTLEEVESIRHICIDAKGNIYVCGSAAEDDAHKVFVYNDQLELQTVLVGEGDFGLGSVVFATQTQNGYLVLDGNMREVVLYNADGSYIGQCDFTDLFGTDYPWPCDAAVVEDGSILIIMTDERPDESADELIAFKLTGF